MLYLSFCHRRRKIVCDIKEKLVVRSPFSCGYPYFRFLSDRGELIRLAVLRELTERQISTLVEFIIRSPPLRARGLDKRSPRVHSMWFLPVRLRTWRIAAHNSVPALLDTRRVSRWSSTVPTLLSQYDSGRTTSKCVTKIRSFSRTALFSTTRRPAAGPLRFKCHEACTGNQWQILKSWPGK